MPLCRVKGSPFWFYDFWFGGKRYRKSTKERTKAAAGTVEAEALSRLSRGLSLPEKAAKCKTLREFSIRFLEWVEATNTLQPNSKRFYQAGVRLLMWAKVGSSTLLADVPLNVITKEMIECLKFHRQLINRRTNQPTGEWVECGQTYINQALRTLRVLLGKAVDMKFLRERPKMSVPKNRSRDQVICMDTEIKLQMAFETPTVNKRNSSARKRAWLITMLIQDTGMRPDEVYPMRAENIRWSEHRIWIPEGKTENATRFVGMSQRVREALIDWVGDRSSGWVFPSSRSESGHLESIHGAFKAARQRAGVDKRIVLYSARHTYGTTMMEATGNIFAVSKSMGHADIKSMEPYQHPDTRLLNSAVNQRNEQRDQRMQQLKSKQFGQTFGQTLGPRLLQRA